MEHSDRSRFRELIVAIAELYGKTLSTPLIRMWWQALKDRPFEDVSRALNAHARDPDRGQFMPKPADVARQIDGPGDSRALEAWTKVERGIERHGGWGCIAFDDPAIHAVCEDMGGWESLCSMTYEELPFRRNEFCKRYLAYLNQPPTSYPPLLVGAGGRDFDRPVTLIGNADKAKQIMDSHHDVRLAITQDHGGAGR